MQRVDLNPQSWAFGLFPGRIATNPAPQMRAQTQRGVMAAFRTTFRNGTAETRKSGHIVACNVNASRITVKNATQSLNYCHWGANRTLASDFV